MAETQFTSKQVASGSAWTLVGFGVASAIRLGSSLVLTRSLPDATEAYGVMAVVWGFYGGILLFSDIGVGLLLTQHPRGLEPEFRHTAFSASIIRGFAIWLAAAGLAPLFSSAYPDFHNLRELLTAVALTAVIGGFTSTSLLALRRRMRVATVAKIEIAAQVFGTAFTLTHALIWPSVWAMVSGTIASITLKVILSHFYNDHPDRPRWSREAIAQLKGIGWWVFLSTALTFCSDHSDRLIFGRLLANGQLGVYAVVAIYANTVGNLLRSLYSNVAYPLLCQAERIHGGAEQVFRTACLPLSAAGGFIYTFLCGGGGALMQLLYEGDFALGGWMLQITAFGAYFTTTLREARSQTILAKARPKYTAIANGSMVLAMSILIPFGYYALGVPGAIAGLSAANIARYTVTATLGLRLGIGALGQDLALALRFCMVSAATLWLDETLQETGAPPLARCLSAGGMAATAWLPLFWASLKTLKKMPNAVT